MKLYDWFVTWLLPLFGDIPAAELAEFTKFFWFSVGLVAVHFCIWVPYRFICKLIHFDGGLLPWLKSKRL